MLQSQRSLPYTYRSKKYIFVAISLLLEQVPWAQVVSSSIWVDAEHDNNYLYVYKQAHIYTKTLLFDCSRFCLDAVSNHKAFMFLISATTSVFFFESLVHGWRVTASRASISSCTNENDCERVNDGWRFIKM